MRTQWKDICKVDDLVPERGVCAQVGDRQVAVFYAEDEEKVYAVDNFDPIGEANVISRGLMGDCLGEMVVASPLFKRRFSLITGRCLDDDAMGLRTYAARLVGGWLGQIWPEPMSPEAVPAT